MKFAANGKFCSEHIEKNLKKQPSPLAAFLIFRPFHFLFLPLRPDRVK